MFAVSHVAINVVGNEATLTVFLSLFQIVIYALGCRLYGIHCCRESVHKHIMASKGVVEVGGHRIYTRDRSRDP